MFSYKDLWSWSSIRIITDLKHMSLRCSESSWTSCWHTMEWPPTGDVQASRTVPCWSLAQALARLSCALQYALSEAAIMNHNWWELEAVCRRSASTRGHMYYCKSQLCLKPNWSTRINQTAMVSTQNGWLPALQCYVDQWLDHAVLGHGVWHQPLAVPVVTILEILDLRELT